MKLYEKLLRKIRDDILPKKSARKNNTTARQETVGLEGLELNNEPYITVANPIKL